jgi:hypothetical protein
LRIGDVRCATNARYVVISFSQQCEGPSVPQSPVVVMIALETNRSADEFASLCPEPPRRSISCQASGATG